MIKKRMIRLFSFFSISTLFLCLISCGIPNIYVPDDYSIPSGNDNTNTITLYDDMVSAELNKNGFPRLVLFYQIVPKENNNGFDSAISHFNSSYCDETTGLRISIEKAKDNENAFYTYNYTSYGSNPGGIYGIFQFSTSTSSDDRIAYIKEADIEGNPTKWNLTFNIDSGNILNLTLNNNTEIKLYRSNGKTFSKDSASYVGNEIPSEFSNSTSITGYTLNIFALVTTEFNDYTNIFNTKLKQIAKLDLPF